MFICKHERRATHAPCDARRPRLSASIRHQLRRGATPGTIGLQAGGSDLYLEDGSEILFTQSAIVLENLIDKFLVNAGSKDED